MKSRLFPSYCFVLIAFVSSSFPSLVAAFLHGVAVGSGGSVNVPSDVSLAAGRATTFYNACIGGGAAVDCRKVSMHQLYNNHHTANTPSRSPLLQLSAHSTNSQGNVPFAYRRRCDKKYAISYGLKMAQSASSEGDDEDTDEDDEPNYGTTPTSSNNVPGSSIPSRSKIDAIKNWMGTGRSKSDGSSRMVRPIRMEDGSIIEDDDQPKRMRPKLDDLLTGMPRLDQILGTEAQKAENGNNDSSKVASSSFDDDDDDDDDDWFEEERKNIEETYKGILQEMKYSLELQRDTDPDNVPDNSEALMEYVLKQEMDREIKAKREQMERERLDQYAVEQRQLNDEQDQQETINVSEEDQKELDGLIQKDLEQLKQMQASEVQLDEFLKYEQEASVRFAAVTDEATSKIRQPEVGEDMDQWALDRLQDMANTASNDGDEVNDVTDILDSYIEDLQERIKNAAKKSSSIKPETMKEWQMYRAIATKLASTNGYMDGQEMTLDDEEKIAAVLQSWKDYLAKEVINREKSNLTRGPKLPFEWYEFENKNKDITKSSDGISGQKLSQVELRKNVNRMSIEAMESLLQKGTGTSSRIEQMKKELELLKSSLESQDYLDVDESLIVEQERKDAGPIDLSDVFGSPKEGQGKGSNKEVVSPLERDMSYRPVGRGSTSDDIGNQVDDDATMSLPPPNTPFFSGEESETTRSQPPPKTPFFSENSEAEIKSSQPPPPNTPFFSDDSGDATDDDLELESSENGEKQQVSYTLGSLEEQKLRAMYQRAGARNAAEQEAIKAQWKDFQKFDKAKRELSRLDTTDDNDSDSDEKLISEAKINYDISDVMKDDGDFDAEKILKSIGPRPTRSKKPVAGSSSTTTTSVSSGSEGTNSIGGTDATTNKKEAEEADDEEFTVPESTLDPEEVSSSLYRAVSAIGGGRNKDNPEAKSIEEAAFKDYMKREDELRQSLDQVDKQIKSEISNITSDESMIFNDTEYADEALASLGQRPKPTRKGRIINEADYSDRGGALADKDEDEEEEESEEFDQIFSAKDEDAPKDSGSQDDLIPGWLRKEREIARSKGEGDSDSGSSGSRRGGFLGSDIDDLFDDDKYEHNMRQLAEYERRRAGKKKQMGIDISEVLGRSSDDYADYNYDDNYFRGSSGDSSGGWGEATFEARKRNLMDYTELDIEEVNSVMEYKHSVHATGVSQYMRRINKPFREFGAIFRLEGVLIDVTGFQWKAWKIVADKFGFKPPSLEDARQASVLPPEVVIRETFYWTNDFMLCRDVSVAHRAALKEVFGQWMEENGLTSKGEQAEDTGKRGSLAIGEEIVKENSSSPVIRTAPVIPSTTSDEEKLNMLTRAWSKTALECGFAPPTLEQVMFAAGLSADIAIMEAFQWSKDAVEVDKYVASFHSNLRGLNENVVRDEGAAGGASVLQAINNNAVPSTSQKRRLDENAMMEIQYKTWTKIAEENGFELPLPEEVVAAVVINDPVIAIRDGFGWTSDPSMIQNLVQYYQKLLKNLIDEWVNGIENKSGSTNPATNSAAATSEEGQLQKVLQMQAHAWKVTADSYGFKPPSEDQVKLAMDVAPVEAVERLFEWGTGGICKSIASTYELALKEASNHSASKSKLLENVNTDENSTHGNDSNSSNAPSADMIFQMASEAWAAVAMKYGYSKPDEEQLLFALSVGPEEAVVTGFEWHSDPEEVAKIVLEYKNELQHKRAALGLSSTTDASTNILLSQPKQKNQKNDDKIFQVAFDAWTAVAAKYEYEPPDTEQVIFAMSVGPEEAVKTGFRWKDDKKEIEKLVRDYMDEIRQRRGQLHSIDDRLSSIDSGSSGGDSTFGNMEKDGVEAPSIPLFQVRPGAAEWVKSLLDVEMQCGIVSYLDDDQAEMLLTQSNMSNLFGRDKIVSASNGYRRDQDQLLGAALRLERRPDHCVVFDSSSLMSNAAHDVEMRSVSLIGAFPRFDLLASDCTASSFDELSAMNIRRLFSERVFDQPMADTQQNDPAKIRKTMTKYRWDDDI